MMRSNLLIFILAIGSFLCGGLKAQESEIVVELRDTILSEIYLGYHYGDKQYILDTSVVDQKGRHVFSLSDTTEAGVYLVVFPPDNIFLELLIDHEQKDILLSTTFSDPASNVRIAKKGQNKDFYDYIAFIKNQKQRTKELTDRKSEGEITEQQFNDKMEEINAEVEKTQEELINKNKGSLLEIVLLSGLQVDVPEYDSLSGREKQQAQFNYYKEHYFDNLRLDDNRSLRTPFLYQRIMTYVERMTPQYPDSISKAIDDILVQMDPESELFKFYLINFINKYSRSKIVGQDAVFVHLAENYYAQGLAPWSSEENRTKIVKQAQRLKPILLGKKAPNFSFNTVDGQKMDLHSIESDFLVLVFWDPDCGVCKKSIPKIKKFAEANQDRGVKILGICTKRKDDEQECWDAVQDKGIESWINGYDPYNRYKPVYDVVSTPMIYFLDDEKVILSKKIGAEQLQDIFDVFHSEKM